MRKSNLEIDATLAVILCALQYFKNVPNNAAARKILLKKYRNIKHRIKLLVNDVYDYLIRNQGFESGISSGLPPQGSPNSKGIWDHAIPWDVFFFYLANKNFTSPTALFDYLKKTFCPCRITPDENERLDNAKLRSKMPANWNNWDDRYEETRPKVVLLKPPVNPSNPNLNITKSTL